MGTLERNRQVASKFVAILNRRLPLNKQIPTYIQNDFMHTIWSVYDQPVYTENNVRYRREYHTFDHAASCCDLLDWVRFKAKSRPFDFLSADQWDRMFIAFIYHDIVYLTKNLNGKTNEQLSAEFCVQHLKQAGIEPGEANLIGSLVGATDHSSQPTGSSSLMLMQDIDLAGLGSSYSSFEADGRKIRAEYAWVSDLEFNMNRCNFFKMLESRQFIYNTPFFQDNYEQTARENIKKHINALDAAIS